jgi:hypothetical protein
MLGCYYYQYNAWLLLLLLPVRLRVYSALHARQLSLKLLANTTYGYTSASFSGRMPCAEIADAIVCTARQALEDAISLVSSDADWRAEVCVWVCTVMGEGGVW